MHFVFYLVFGLSGPAVFSAEQVRCKCQASFELRNISNYSHKKGNVNTNSYFSSKLMSWNLISGLSQTPGEMRETEQ